VRASLEVADILRAAGPAYRAARAGHLSLHQLKVMSAIEHCRTAALGGHVEACEDCGHQRIAYNSCRNRHCPKSQGGAARMWLAGREADLLPVGYFHIDMDTFYASVELLGPRDREAELIAYPLPVPIVKEKVVSDLLSPRTGRARSNRWESLLTHAVSCPLDGDHLRIPHTGVGAL